MTAELDDRSAQVQALARRLVTELGQKLERLGYDLVVLHVAKVVRTGDQCHAPGSTYCSASPRIAAALPREADNLRSIAEQLDRHFAASGKQREATEGYVEDVSRELLS